MGSCIDQNTIALQSIGTDTSAAPSPNPTTYSPSCNFADQAWRSGCGLQVGTSSHKPQGCARLCDDGLPSLADDLFSDEAPAQVIYFVDDSSSHIYYYLLYLLTVSLCFLLDHLDTCVVSAPISSYIYESVICTHLHRVLPSQTYSCQNVRERILQLRRAASTTTTLRHLQQYSSVIPAK
jgi:hypothetical protein